MDNLDFALIGKRIKEVRTDRQLTQEYLAKVTDVNVSHISNIETNKVKVSLTLLVSICNAMNVTVDYILCREKNPPLDKQGGRGVKIPVYGEIAALSFVGLMILFLTRKREELKER